MKTHENPLDRVEKAITNFFGKKNYVLHHKNLAVLFETKVEKIH